MLIKFSAFCFPDAWWIYEIEGWGASSRLTMAPGMSGSVEGLKKAKVRRT